MVNQHPLTRASVAAINGGVAARREVGVAAWVQLGKALADEELSAKVDAAGVDLVSALAGGHTLLVCGNGGSAAIASHVAGEFIGKCIHDRDPLPAVSLAESISSLTAVGNDYGYEKVFTRGVAALGREGDVLLAMTTSGTSPNVVAALALARDRGIKTIAMTGARGTSLEGQADHVLIAPSDETPRIQEVHMLWAHAWCEAIDVLSSDSAH